MRIFLNFALIGSISVCFLMEAQGADKYTVENRPYEFGFTIDGEQHRHEKKDEKGLIMGEFGFITADGVYHVTVYATDEQGRFKILSMKNIRTMPYPTYKQTDTSARQGHSLGLSGSQQKLQSQAVTTTPKPFKKMSIEPLVNSCSHCSVPTTSTAAPPIPVVNQFIDDGPNQIQSAGRPKYPVDIKLRSGFIDSPITQQNIGLQRNFAGATQNNFNNLQGNLETSKVPKPYINVSGPQAAVPFGNVPDTQATLPLGNVPNPQSVQAVNVPDMDLVAPPSNFGQQNSGAKISQDIPLNYFPRSPGNVDFPQQTTHSQNRNYAQAPQTPLINAGGRNPKKLDDMQQIGSIGTQPNNIERGLPNSDQNVLVKPTLISAQIQLVDKNTDIYQRSPGEREGLPDGLTKDDMTDLLYTFNYTVGFHGHFEEGYRNGAKQGYYYVTGRNGIRTRIDYVADSKGFRPKITQEVLDLLSDDVPKPESEREEKYGLKGYEFKWLYYPIESKGR